MVVDNIRKMSVKGVKVKVRKLLFNISWRFGVMEEKPSGRGASEAPGPDRVKAIKAFLMQNLSLVAHLVLEI